jgi:hypothetical protein
VSAQSVRTEPIGSVMGVREHEGAHGAQFSVGLIRTHDSDMGRGGEEGVRVERAGARGIESDARSTWLVTGRVVWVMDHHPR